MRRGSSLLWEACLSVCPSTLCLSRSICLSVYQSVRRSVSLSVRTPSFERRHIEAWVIFTLGSDLSSHLLDYGHVGHGFGMSPLLCGCMCMCMCARACVCVCVYVCGCVLACGEPIQYTPMYVRRQIDRQTDRQTDGQTDGLMDGRTGGRTDGRTDRQTDTIARECTHLRTYVYTRAHTQ